MRLAVFQAVTALVCALAGGSATTWAQSGSILQPGAAANPSYTGGYDAPPEAKTGGILTGYDDPQSGPAATAPTTSDAPGVWSSVCEFSRSEVGTWRDNTVLQFGGEAFKSMGDTFPGPVANADFMNSFGLVGTFNTGFALGSLEKIRGQIGASYGVYDLKGRDTLERSSSEQQTFVTAGIYKRSDVCSEDRLSWGAVYDQFWAHQWGRNAAELYVGQARAIVGWAVSEQNEFGMWGAFRATGDNSVIGNAPPPLRAMNQYNAYWRHNYEFGGQTMLYVGGNDPSDFGSWQFGAMGLVPLSDTLALYGNFAFDEPSSGRGIVGSNEQRWAIAAGVAYYFGGKAVSPSVSGRQGLPLLPVANNGSLFITN